MLRDRNMQIPACWTVVENVDDFFPSNAVKKLAWDKITVFLFSYCNCVRIYDYVSTVFSFVHLLRDRLPTFEMIGDREGTRLDYLQKKIRDMTS